MTQPVRIIGNYLSYVRKRRWRCTSKGCRTKSPDRAFLATDASRT
jgi:hypothetical protein